jgi:hypothetical protein
MTADKCEATPEEGYLHANDNVSWAGAGIARYVGPYILAIHINALTVRSPIRFIFIRFRINWRIARGSSLKIPKQPSNCVGIIL